MLHCILSTEQKSPKKHEINAKDIGSCPQFNCHNRMGLEKKPWIPACPPWLTRAESWIWFKSTICTAENFWHGSDRSSTRTKKIVFITHLHVRFCTVLNDVKLWFGTGKRLNISSGVLDSCLVRMLLLL